MLRLVFLWFDLVKAFNQIALVESDMLRLVFLWFDLVKAFNQIALVESDMLRLVFLWFDLVKAFNQIALKESDMLRLVFLWFDLVKAFNQIALKESDMLRLVFLWFDLVKAFNQIALKESDMLRLMFLWFEDVANNNFKLVAYMNARLPFGLRCLPSILMLAVYRILILDDSGDQKLNELKRMIWHLAYMENCTFTRNNAEELLQAYHSLERIFPPCKFELQQFVCNDVSVQKIIDVKENGVTPTKTKLFGLNWETGTDQ